METNEILGEVLSLLDETERALSGDELFENSQKYTYIVRDKPKEREKNLLERIDTCRKCALSRSPYRFHIGSLERASYRALFIVSSPSSFSLFSADEKRFFDAWLGVLGLKKGEYEVLSLLKCHSEYLYQESVDQCKPYLQEELRLIDTPLYILLGEDISRSITHLNVPFDDMRSKSVRINGVRTRMTFHPRDLVNNYSYVRKEVFKDLLDIKERSMEMVD